MWKIKKTKEGRGGGRKEGRKIKSINPETVMSSKNFSVLSMTVSVSCLYFFVLLGVSTDWMIPFHTDRVFCSFQFVKFSRNT